MEDRKWLFCPICKNKTRIQIGKETEIVNFPLFCPKCKKETMINVKEQQLSVVETGKGEKT